MSVIQARSQDLDVNLIDKKIDQVWCGVVCGRGCGGGGVGVVVMGGGGAARGARGKGRGFRLQLEHTAMLHDCIRSRHPTMLHHHCCRRRR